MTALMVAVAFVAALVLTGRVRRYALRASVMDVPNERSSHTVPTPRGGGLAIVAVLFAAVAWLWSRGAVDGPLAAALIGGCGANAVVGWIDDRRSVSPLWKLMVQTAAAVWAAGWLIAPAGAGVMAWAAAAGAVLALVWLTNLYNFMDGIDGLAGVEAVTAGSGAALILAAAGAPGLAAVAAALAAASAGFLVWNWPPARIFMGDVGSGTVGFVFGVLALAADRAHAVPAAAWVILLGVFVLDATFTLMQRVVEGERWYTAHRSHAYQRAVQSGMSHRRVTAAVAAANLLLLWPLAWLATQSPALQPWLLLAVTVGGYAIWHAVQRHWRHTAAA